MEVGPGRRYRCRLGKAARRGGVNGKETGPQDGLGPGQQAGGSSSSAPEVVPKRFTLNGDPDEDQIQKSIADLLDWILPEEVAWSHFPAGGYLLSKAAQARLYRLGLKRGFPDLMICYPPKRTLWLEVKAPRGVLSKAQKARHAQLQALGHVVVVVRSVDDALQALWTYGVPIRRARIAEGFLGKSSADTSRPQERAQGPSAGPAHPGLLR